MGAWLRFWDEPDIGECTNLSMLGDPFRACVPRFSEWADGLEMLEMLNGSLLADWVLDLLVVFTREALKVFDAVVRFVEVAVVDVAPVRDRSEVMLPDFAVE